MMNPTPAFDMLLFGGTGDLVMRKLLPALFGAHAAGLLHPQGCVFALGRQPLSRDDYLALAARDARAHCEGADDARWAAFCARIDYLQVDATRAADFAALAERLSGDDAGRVRVVYLATAPSLFVPVCEHLAGAGLADTRTRLVLEKPLGHDLASADAINDAVSRHFAEDQLYRIDHYLGKESVQNLLALRFGNTLFEPLWRREWVESVQVTLAEEIGVAGRGEFYERTGALRDMVQNHLLQLLCIVAMEPPASLDADAVRDEKLKVLKALAPFDAASVARDAVRGQYQAGASGGAAVEGYRAEEGVAADSRTETYVALKTSIGNWRWAGVPFYLRTGKRLAERKAEIVITFRDVPHKLFDVPPMCRNANRLVIELQPEESIRLWFRAKTPGDGMDLQPVSLNLDFHETFRGRRVDAYERLLLDVIRGRLALFMRRDEQAAAWRWVEPLLAAWAADASGPRPYMAGSWGPAAASTLIARDGLSWPEEC